MRAVSRQQEQQAQTFRSLFQEAIKPYVSMPLMLSGGTDSMTNLAGILSLGYKPPHCYTFQVGNRESSDAKVSRSVCKYFDIPHTIVSIPQNEETLIADIRRVLPIVCRLRKIHIQCAHPFLYLAEAAFNDGYRDASFAMNADDLWGVSRFFSVGIKEHGEEWFTQKRREWLAWEGGSDISCIKTALSCGVQIYDSFRNPDLIDFLLSCKSYDIHIPVQKGLAIRAFPEFWKCGKWYRTNSPLQINSGLREWHDTLLQSKYNVSHAKAIIVIYRRLFSEIHQGVPNA
ncbi:MAG TPA: asparagine synthase-related protein [Ktedonobacteraceae bacterium]|jgi:hypothetical protein|nr:asparagine synthase-related protein [Ktedonobacteraceae bacterium]